MPLDLLTVAPGRRLGMEALKFQRMCWMADNYLPSVEQLSFHQSPAWIRLVAGGVRGGKSYSTARECDKYTSVEDGLGWLIGPDYEQPRAELDYLYSLYSRMGWVDEGSVSFPSKGPASFSTTWGFSWETKSATKDVRSLASFAPDVVVMCEAAQQPYDVFLKAVERANEKSADIIMSGTFESSRGWYAEKWTEYQGANDSGGVSFSLPTWSNLAVYPGGRTDPKILRAETTMPPELFLERFGGIPAKPEGIVFPAFSRRVHMADMEYDPDFPLEIAVDPGNHAYAILFIQRRGPKVYILDEIYRRGIIAQQIIPEFLSHELSKFVSRGVMDVAGKQHQANYSQLEVWWQELTEAGREPIDFETRKIFETDWRNAIALRLGNTEGREPNLFINSHLSSPGLTKDGKALGIVAELETYRWPRRGEMAGLPMRPTKTNEDALSALGYYLVARYGSVLERTAPEYRRKQRAYPV